MSTRIIYPKRLLLNICWARNLPMPPALAFRPMKYGGNYPIPARPREVE